MAMSAVFKQHENDRGIELPVMKPVTKSTLCTLLGIDGKEWLHIINEEQITEKVLFRNNSEFFPLKPRIYLVKTGFETFKWGKNDLKSVGKLLCEKPSVPLLQFPFLNLLIRSQPDEMIRKVISKFDPVSFGNVTQSCDEMYNLLTSQKFSIHIPQSLIISFHYCGFKRMTFEREGSDVKKFSTYNEEYFRILRPFKLKALYLDAENSDATRKSIDDVCNKMIQNRIQTQNLVVIGIHPSLVAKLATGIRANRVTYKKGADLEYADFTTNEPFRVLHIIEFPGEFFVRYNYEPNIFSSFFFRNAVVIRIRCEFDWRKIMRYSLKKYIENTERGSNKVLEMIKTDNVKLEQFFKLFHGRIREPVECGYEPIRNCKVHANCIIHSANGDFFVEVKHDESSKSITLCIGPRGPEFWDVVKHL